MKNTKILQSLISLFTIICTTGVNINASSTTPKTNDFYISNSFLSDNSSEPWSTSETTADVSASATAVHPSSEERRQPISSQSLTTSTVFPLLANRSISTNSKTLPSAADVSASATAVHPSSEEVTLSTLLQSAQDLYNHTVEDLDNYVDLRHREEYFKNSNLIKNITEMTHIPSISDATVKKMNISAHKSWLKIDKGDQLNSDQFITWLQESIKEIDPAFVANINEMTRYASLISSPSAESMFNKMTNKDSTFSTQTFDPLLNSIVSQNLGITTTQLLNNLQKNSAFTKAYNQIKIQAMDNALCWAKEKKGTSSINPVKFQNWIDEINKKIDENLKSKLN